MLQAFALTRRELCAEFGAREARIRTLVFVLATAALLIASALIMIAR